jgi:hypothetical protein
MPMLFAAMRLIFDLIIMPPNHAPTTATRMPP